MADDGKILLDVAALNQGLTPPTVALPPRAGALLSTFFDAAGNVIADTRARDLFTQFSTTQVSAPAEQAVTQITNNYNNMFNADVSQINGTLSSILAALAKKASDAEAVAQNALFQTVQLGERLITTNAVPVLSKLDAITAGAGSFNALPESVVTALFSSIPFALDFIQADRLSESNRLLSTAAQGILAAPGNIVSGVGDALGALGKGLLDGIGKLLTRVESVLIDPISALLAAILAELRSLPGKAAAAVWDALLVDSSPPASGS